MDTSESYILPSSLQKKYEVLETIHASRRGAIFKVRHRLFGSVRIAKLMRAHHIDDENLQLRYRRAARIALRLRHPNIARFYDFKMTTDTACLVREFIDGKTFQEILAHDGLPPLYLTLTLADQCLEMLAYLHGQGYVHRDISTENLMLTIDVSGAPQAKLIALGLAKRLSGGEDLTATDVFVGLARYSAPEQFHESPPDPRSDLYSFGVVLYEMLTGHHPIAGDSFADFFKGHLTKAPRDFAETDPDDRVPLGLRKVVLQSLEKNPGYRMESAKEFAELLAPYVEEARRTIDELELNW